MSNKQKRESDFLVQGSILAIASIISRIIGLVYRIPLTNIIGNGGNDYYGAAFDVYNILLLISSFSLPLAVSKLVAARISKGERRNAYRIFKGALLFALISGTFASLVVFFGADFITSVLLATPQSYLALKVLGPTLLIVAVMGVIRGFFQGMGSMVPSAVSQIIEQIVNAIVSVAAAYYLFSYGLKVGEVLGDTKTYSEAYGAAGGTLGTGAGAIVGLIFLCLVLFAFLKVFKKRMRSQPKSKNESYTLVFKVLIFTIVPVLLSTTVYNISSILDQGIFKNVAVIQGYDSYSISQWWGIFCGKYKVLTNVPIAIASALAASCVPSIASAFSTNSFDSVRRKIDTSMRFSMAIAFPCAVGLAVLAEPVLNLLFNDTQEWTRLGARLIQVGAVSIVLYSISTMSNAILQGINRMREPVRNAIVSLALHLIILLVMLFGLHLNIYAVVLSNVCFALIMCLLNGRSIAKYMDYKQEIKKTFVIPGISSLLMGVVVFAVYKLTMMLCNINSLCTILAIFAGMIIYLVLLIRLKGITPDELVNFPKGSMFLRIFKKIHLM